MNWYYKIIGDPDEYQHVLDAVDYFNNELKQARREVFFKDSIEKASTSLPGIVEYRFSQLQEIEAILEHLNIQYKRVRAKKVKYYMETYQRKLTSSDAKLYADGDDETLAIAELINHVSYVRNRYLAITKALENKGFQINNVIKLRTSGMEDAEIGDIYIPDPNY